MSDEVKTQTQPAPQPENKEENKGESKGENALPRFRPATDILEKEDGFHIFMDLPGVKKEDLVIDLKENELVLSAKAITSRPQERRSLEMEFGNGEYRRSFSLSDIVDREQIKANLQNGVLEIFMPKKEKVLPKRIEIKAG